MLERHPRLMIPKTNCCVVKADTVAQSPQDEEMKEVKGREDKWPKILNNKNIGSFTMEQSRAAEPRMLSSFVEKA